MTELEIINYGLLKLAVDEIDTYDSLTAQGRVARAFYPHLKEKAIEGFNWPFARTESSALALVGTSETGNQQFQLPNGVEMITSVHNQNGHEMTFKVVGQLLELTEQDIGDANTLHVEYIKNVDEGKFPAYFGVALGTDLAANACMTLTENASLAERLEAKADKLWRKARMLARQSAGNEQLADESEYSMIANRRG